jgi:phospholipase D1/2
MEVKKEHNLTNAARWTIAAFIVCGAALAWFLISHYQAEIQWIRDEDIRSFLENSRSEIWALPMVCLIYVVGGFVLFPVTVLSLMIAAVFGPILGPTYAMCGALCTASVMFYLGRWGGKKGLRKFLGDRLLKVDAHFANAGVVGVAILRFIPVAPFSLVNMAAGLSSVLFSDFVIGTFLGLLPAFIAKGLVGDSLVQTFMHPTKENFHYLVVGVLVWAGLVGASFFLARRWQKRHE